MATVENLKCNVIFWYIYSHLQNKIISHTRISGSWMESLRSENRLRVPPPGEGGGSFESEGPRRQCPQASLIERLCLPSKAAFFKVFHPDFK